ncbi:MAG: hypothetical protein AVO34_06005 [Firmicutes bacterium ML8_F2]|nr:MAG: hypothetical protein AVO34_06005 [Firmicutes bacterium ML8_F2]
MDHPRQGPGVAYIHLPYCETHCLYCGFFGGQYEPDRAERYLDALLNEIVCESGRAAVGNGPLQAIYLGGGPPTALTAEQLARLMGTVRRYLPLAEDCEITVEGRIHGFTDDKLQACMEAGANRFSLGIQTFNTRIRRALGHIESHAELVTSVTRLAELSKAGPRHAAIVFDPIYGLPGQTRENWRQDLEQFLALPLDGTDLYQLNLFPQGKLAAAINSGRTEPPPSLTEQSQYFSIGVRRLQTAGLQRLSICHWGRNPLERNRCNLLTKGGGRLAGLRQRCRRQPERPSLCQRQGSGRVPETARRRTLQTGRHVGDPAGEAERGALHCQPTGMRRPRLASFRKGKWLFTGGDAVRTANQPLAGIGAGVRQRCRHGTDSGRSVLADQSLPIAVGMAVSACGGRLMVFQASNNVRRPGDIDEAPLANPPKATPLSRSRPAAIR